MKETIDTAAARLEEKPGVIAVFTAYRWRERGTIDRVPPGASMWVGPVRHAMDLHQSCACADLIVTIGDAQQVRVMSERDGQVALAVVVTAQNPYGKSLPRTMHRLLKIMCDEQRSTETIEVVGPTEATC